MTSSKGGRPSPWTSSSKTRLIRVPEYMAEEILEIARIKDRGGDISIIQNHNNSIVQNNDKKVQLQKVMELIENYKAKSHPTSIRWQFLNKFIAELEEALLIS